MLFLIFQPSDNSGGFLFFMGMTVLSDMAHGDPEAIDHCINNRIELQ